MLSLPSYGGIPCFAPLADWSGKVVRVMLIEGVNGTAQRAKEKDIVLYILIGLVVIFAVAIFGMAGLAVSRVAEIVASCDEHDESPNDGDDNLVVRIGCAVESMLKIPYSHILTCVGWKT